MAELKNEFSWSRSRASTFDDCARRYWFTYYGSWGGWKEYAPPRIRQAYILKQLQSRWMWVGDIVHEQVAMILRSAQMGRTMSEADATEASLTKMREDYRNSKAGEYRTRPKKVVGLIEHEYEEAISDEQWKEVAELMKSCIATFYKSPWLKKLPSMERGAWLPIEELSHFFLDKVKIYVKPDFAYRTAEGKVEIVDWKTGRREEDPDPVQLACYSLYALDKGWAKSAGDVTTVEYRLALGKGSESVMDDAKLETVKGRMRTSIASMQGLLDDRATNAASESKFPVATDARVCRSCGYRKICPDKPVK